LGRWDAFDVSFGNTKKCEMSYKALNWKIMPSITRVSKVFGHACNKNPSFQQAT
jgi:hypothetical protein